MDRREFFLGGAAALSVGAAWGTNAFAQQAAPINLNVQNASFDLGKGITRGLVSTVSNAPPPVLHLRKNQPAKLRVGNQLSDYTTMHWHGLRIPNKMDGVPYLTQFPIGPGSSFDYEFTPPDSGTYWYHPHCQTMEQMAHGLTGILVVEDENDPQFDAEIALNLKDFHLDKNGGLDTPYTKRGAARGGTMGNVMTSNWLQNPTYDAPAGGIVRLRIAATDTARIYRLALSGAKGKLVAIDGHATDLVPWPTKDAPLILAPGQRVDMAIQMPEEGQAVTLNHHALSGSRALAQLRPAGQSLKHQLDDLPTLPRNQLPEPDLSTAETHEFLFGWTPEADPQNNGWCGSLGYSFWSINKTPWPGDAEPNVGPLAEMKLGKSYILRLRNESPNDHPIHLHGLVFKLLRSNKREIPQIWTDTAHLLKDETMEVALVADNLGDWAFHCHVIEHQKSGLAGYLSVV
jgi:FtsP/CotA-like multicopper oxidase with cupredoxin domain